MATEIVWSQFINEQKVDLTHKTLDNVPSDDVSQWEGVESVNVSFNFYFLLEKCKTNLKSVLIRRILVNQHQLLYLYNLSCMFIMHSVCEFYLRYNNIA